MLSQKESLKRKFLFRLTAVVLLLLLLSFSILYIHTNSRISHNLESHLDTVAKQIVQYEEDRLFFFAKSFGVYVEKIESEKEKKLYTKDGNSYLSKTYEGDWGLYYITMDVSHIKDLERDLLNAILAIVMLTTVVILFYISYLTKTFLQPIFELSHKLSDMNENFMKSIDTNALPVEFRALGKSINGLVTRIQNYIKYQKELFTGVSHELKTPLAVLKTKNQVVLIKDRDPQKYKQTLKENIEIVDEVNKMISTVLEFGRQESAQFEPAQEVDIFAFLHKKVEDFEVISGDKTIETKIAKEALLLQIQPTLLNQIFQNFMQNALKFCKQRVVVEAKQVQNKVVISIADDGEGLPEDFDIFAPFKRDVKSQGIGLGLYLAKSAAHAIGAQIDIQNADAVGVVATIEIEI